MATPKAMRVGRVGIYAKRGPSADGEWYWMARDTGGSRDVRWRGWATAEAALEAVTDIVQRDLLADPTPETPGSVAALCAGWLAANVEGRRDIAYETRRAYTRDINAIVDAIGTARASTLTNDALGAYRDRRLGEGAAPSTVRQELKRLLSVWRWGVDRRQLPARALKMPRLKVRPVRSQHTPSEREVLAVRDAMTANWARVALDLIWAMGLRAHEAAGLQWRDVLDDQLRIEGKSTDRNPSGVRWFPRNRRVREALERAVLGGPDDTLTGVGPGRVRAQLAARWGRHALRSGSRTSRPTMSAAPSRTGWQRRASRSRTSPTSSATPR